MKLIIRRGDRSFEFPLRTGVLIAGRDPDCDLVLGSKKVSRRHARLTVMPDEVIVADLGSRNGLYIGDVQVKEGRLGDGDEVRIGDFSLTFASGRAVPADVPVAQAVPAAAAAGEPAAGEADEEETPPADEELLLPAVRSGAQPQLVEKEGKLFVVDPASGREVEIVPVRPGLPAEPVSVTRLPTGKKRMRMIMIGMGAFVGLLVLAAIVKQAQPAPPPQMMAKREYTNLLDNAVRAIDADNILEAGKAIEGARAGRPKDEEGHILRDIAIRWNSWQKDFLGGADEMEKLLREFRRYQSTPTSIEFTDKWLRKIRQERAYSGYVYEAQRLIKEGKLGEALDLLGKLPADSRTRLKYADLIDRTRSSLIKDLTDKLEAAQRAGKWATAVAQVDKLIEQDPARADEYRKLRETLTQRGSEQDALQQAEDSRRQRDYDDALRILSRIPDTSPYAKRARALETDVRGEQTRQHAGVLYRAGQADEALKLVRNDASSAAQSLAARIERVLDARERALAAKKSGDLTAEQDAWLSIQEAEQDQDNAYRREALRELARFRDRLKDRSSQYYEQGRASFQKEDYAAAREFFEKAMRVDPDQENGKAMLAEMTKRGRLEYNRGLNAERDGQKDAALRSYRLAVALGSPEDDFYVKSQDRIHKLAGE